MLRCFSWKVAFCFIDNIIIFSTTFEDYLHDFEDILSIMENTDLIVQPFKGFVGYHSIMILGQLVDCFSLITTEFCKIPYSFEKKKYTPKCLKKDNYTPQL